MVKEIAFIAYPCADVASTRGWYEKHLGLKFTAPYAEDGVEKYNEAPVGNACFSLMTHEWIERKPGTGAGVAFEVDDLNAALTQLKSHGIEVSALYETPVCKLSSFTDPEGNKITLHQITVPH